MKVRAVKDFDKEVEGTLWIVVKGDRFDLPEGRIDWLSAGLVVPGREKKLETAVREPQERAITR